MDNKILKLIILFLVILLTLSWTTPYVIKDSNNYNSFFGNLDKFFLKTKNSDKSYDADKGLGPTGGDTPDHSWASSVCGNSEFEIGEECEDCNVEDGDRCSSNCKFEYCGDGIKQSGDIYSEFCDVGDGCPNGYTCNPEFCNECNEDPAGEAPVVTMTATPSYVRGFNTVVFSVSATDKDSNLVSYKGCVISHGNSAEPACFWNIGGGGCSPEIFIDPSKEHYREWEVNIGADSDYLSNTKVHRVIYTDENGNKGVGSVVIPIYDIGIRTHL